eukprot:s429_g8.t1
MAAERGDLPMLRFLAEAQPLKDQDASRGRRGLGGAGQALIWAALSGHVPVMEFLLSQKASIHATDERGLQPIHFAALESDVSTAAQRLAACHLAPGHRRLVALLLEAGAQPDAQAPKEQDGKERATKEVIDAQALQETAARTVRGAQQLFGNLTGWVREASEKAQSAVADSLAGLGEDGVGMAMAIHDAHDSMVFQVNAV